MPIKPVEKIWMDGKLVDWEKATVHVLSHALHYGSSVFEGVRAYETPRGPAIFRLKDHTRRLFDSAKIYRMEIPYTRDELDEAVCEVVARNEFRSCYVRPICFYGSRSLGVNPRGCPVDEQTRGIELDGHIGELPPQPLELGEQARRNRGEVLFRDGGEVELTHNWDESGYSGGRNFGHLAYEVDDIYATCARLQAAGVTINRPPRDGRMAFVRSPDSISVELLQEGTALTAAEPWASMANTGEW